MDIRRVVANTPGAVEPILCVLREKAEGSAVPEEPPHTTGGPRSPQDLIPIARARMLPQALPCLA